MSISWCKSAYTCTTSESGGYPCTGLAESCLNPFIHKKKVGDLYQSVFWLE